MWKLASPQSVQPAASKAALLTIASSNPSVVTMTPSDAGEIKVMPTTLPIVHGGVLRSRLLELRPVTTPYSDLRKLICPEQLVFICC
jgi:hypothetical protein